MFETSAVNVRDNHDDPLRWRTHGLMRALLPIPAGKRDSGWAYAWIPVIGPLLGAAFAASLYVLLRGHATPLSR